MQSTVVGKSSAQVRLHYSPVFRDKVGIIRVITAESRLCPAPPVISQLLLLLSGNLSEPRVWVLD